MRLVQLAGRGDTEWCELCKGVYYSPKLQELQIFVLDALHDIPSFSGVFTKEEVSAVLLAALDALEGLFLSVRYWSVALFDRADVKEVGEWEGHPYLSRFNFGRN